MLRNILKFLAAWWQAARRPFSEEEAREFGMSSENPHAQRDAQQTSAAHKPPEVTK